MRSGILAAGNWIRDHVRTIDSWPAEESLANIIGHAEGNGGGPYNVLKDLARLGAPFRLAGIGLVGDDEDGRSILADCRAHGIDASQIRSEPGLGTSYTEVMTVKGTGRRTFFHDRGANARLGPRHFDFTRAGERIFYLGYMLLLDSLDAPGPDGAPFAREVLARARSAGLTSALDCVSAASERFRTTVAPVLAEVDVLFANDYEAEQIAGISVGRGAGLDRSAVEAACHALIAMGVRGWAVVHFPEGACACSAGGQMVWQPAVRLQSGQISGSAGAGDALAAGVLFGVHEGWPMERSLELGACAAAASLLHPTCSEGVLPLAECLAFGRGRGFASPA